MGLFHSLVRIGATAAFMSIADGKNEEKEEKKKDYYLSGTSLWHLHAVFLTAGRYRHRQDWGGVQKGRADGYATQEGGDYETGAQDRGEGWLIALISSRRGHAPPFISSPRNYEGWRMTNARAPLLKSRLPKQGVRQVRALLD